MTLFDDNGQNWPSGVIQGYPTGVKRAKTGSEPVKRGQIQSISGPMSMEDPGHRVPGSIQHLSLGHQGHHWLPGHNCRRYRNSNPGTVPWVPLARRE